MTTDHHEMQHDVWTDEALPKKSIPKYQLIFDARERMYKPVKIPQYERGDV